MQIFVFSSICSTFLFGMLFDYRMFLIQLGIVLVYFYGSWKRGCGKTSITKKISMSLWGSPQEPVVLCGLEFNCEKIDNFIESYNKKHPKGRITYTHVFMKIIALSFKKTQKLNGTIAFGHFIPFENVSVTTLVDVEGKNLLSATVKDCNLLPMEELRRQTNAQIKTLKTKKDKSANTQMGLVKILPTAVVSCLVQITYFISYLLGRDVGPVKIKKYNFGNVVVTNVSSMKYYNSFAPLSNFTGCVILLVICKPQKKVVSDANKNPMVRKMIKVNITVDHRFGEGQTMNPIVSNAYRLIDNLDELI